MNKTYEQFLFRDIEIKTVNKNEALVIVPDNLYDFYTSIQTLRLVLVYVRQQTNLRVYSLHITKHSFYQNIIFNDNFILDGVKVSG